MVRLNKLPVANLKNQKTLLSYFTSSPSQDVMKRGEPKPKTDTTDTDKKDEGTEVDSTLKEMEIKTEVVEVKEELIENYEPPSKKLKTENMEVAEESKKSEGDEVNEDVNTTPIKVESSPLPLTPEQKNRMKTNAMDAKLKRISATYKIVDRTMGKSWFEALEPEFGKPYFSMLNQFVCGSQGKVFPPLPKVWEWTKFVPIQDVKVVILGQDPYHGPGQAHGLCFSVPRGIPPPPSLHNMFKELSRDIPGFTQPNHGTLVGWAKQGVLLLNAVLTVNAHQPNSHKDRGWEKLTDAVISWISANMNSVVFLLWGSYAHKKGSFVDKKKHHLLQCAHPSPLSAHRGFLGCGHFSKCNEILMKVGKTPIDWTYLPMQSPEH